ncbi:MAG: DUF362 domain-containing protein [Planctomycetota bacterium]
MTGFDTVVGLYHFLGDMAPKNVPLVEPKPRKSNPWQRNGLPLVSRVKADVDMKPAIGKAVALLGNLGDVVSRGDKVFVKPNFNSPDPFPASTDLMFLRAIVEMLLEAGAKVTIGESSGGIWRPTRNVFRKLGVYELAASLGVELIAFEDAPNGWVRVKVGGDYLKTVTMPRSAYEADKMAYLPCMKTHRLAGYSGALKLSFGFTHPGERRGFHMSNLQQKVAEVNLCWQPDIIVMDGRKAFVSGGPDTGELVETGLILASGDPIAIDVEAVRTLLNYEVKNMLPADPWQLPQIVTALRHGLGASRRDYILCE